MNSTNSPTYDELLVQVRTLREYLSKALADLNICCNDQKGFLKVAYPVKVDMSYESDIYSTLSDKEKELVEKFNLSTIVRTHPYSCGMWKWRFSDEVKAVLEDVCDV